MDISAPKWAPGGLRQPWPGASTTKCVYKPISRLRSSELDSAAVDRCSSLSLFGCLCACLYVWVLPVHILDSCCHSHRCGPLSGCLPRTRCCTWSTSPTGTRRWAEDRRALRCRTCGHDELIVMTDTDLRLGFSVRPLRNLSNVFFLLFFFKGQLVTKRSSEKHSRINTNCFSLSSLL